MIRFAEQRDLPAIYSLWETCFPDEGGFNGYFFSHLYEPQHTLLLMQENTLCAMLQMLPYTLSVNGEPREITYIYGVCTHPAHRRRGYAAELLERSFALDKEKKRAASILIPAEKLLQQELVSARKAENGQWYAITTDPQPKMSESEQMQEMQL